MPLIKSAFCMAAILVLNLSTMNAQDFNGEFTERFYWHFEQSSEKVISLAETMPEEIYNWSPDGEAMSVARVFMHIARHNYMIPERWLGIPAPDHIQQGEMEQISDKETVVRMLKESVEHVRGFSGELTNEKLFQPVTIFGEETHGWAALMLLISHMNEHVGQSVSYARMNGVVPPWSE
ncbi:MAG: DinB family protein [Balneolaceae bacterium]|nr:MAG: DinB family protein [Balneolaceae bacterium]